MKMRILFLTSRIDSPSFRFRVLQYLPYLEKNGLDATIQEVPKDWFKRSLYLFRLNNFDLIFIQRKLLKSIELKQLKKKAKKVCYDFDDALMYKDSRRGAVISKRNQKRFRSITQIADKIIAGNDYLAAKARAYSSNVVVIPTAIDTNLYSPITKEGRDTVILGWIGTKSTLIYLNQIRDVLKKILGNFENVKLKVVCNDFSGLDISDAIMKKWSEEEEIPDLQRFDIGLMPLTDDAWTQGKCGFKIIQYFSVGIPVVCSPVGVNSSIVGDGVTGFFANNSTQWYEKITTLIKDKTLRLKLGEVARRKVQEEYSLKVCAPKLLSVLKGKDYD